VFRGVAKSTPSRASPQLPESLENVNVLDNYVDLTEARVVGDLSGAVLQECSLTRVEFRSCRLSGLQAPRDRFVDVGFFGSRMDGANFRMSIWERAELYDCDLADTDFYESTMPASRILGCDLSRVEFSKGNLAESSLQGSTLDGLRGVASLRKVTIGSDQIIPAAMALFKTLGIIVNDDP
jgi:uncharacterized protein YjbI with pentapeptide repeats